MSWGSRDSACSSSRAIGSRSGAGVNSAWLSRGTAVRSALPRAARSAGARCSGSAARERAACLPTTRGSDVPPPPARAAPLRLAVLGLLAVRGVLARLAAAVLPPVPAVLAPLAVRGLLAAAGLPAALARLAVLGLLALLVRLAPLRLAPPVRLDLPAVPPARADPLARAGVVLLAD